ncbi:MAG: hypothetical protein JXA33_16950 [Anaerolineae bacterium]|nr:hypothetical protein [Anaerolineae bacterium]
MTNWLYENGNDWRLWKSHAEDLLRAAEALEQHGDDHTWHIELMLWGYACEVFLKSWYLKNGGMLYDENGAFKKEAKSHNLAELAKKFSYPLESYTELTDRMTEFIVWAGRYPFAFTESSAYEIPGDRGLLKSWIASLQAELE